jgi:lysine-N-methylase
VSWEIDIDNRSLKKYQKIKGELGAKLKNNISTDGTPKFIIKKDGRCPFLDKDNLCELITKLGDKSLCYICANHPRFYNFLSDRTEVGLGLSCEEVARIVLSQKQKTEFITDGKSGSKPLSKKRLKLLEFRDNVISTLQNREKSISQRLSELEKEFDAKVPNLTLKGVGRFLSKLEVLDKSWLSTLKLLRTDIKKVDYLEYDKKFPETEIEFEQFVVYLAYRHLINAYDIEDFSDRISFIILSVNLIKAFLVANYKITGESEFFERVEFFRSFSTEIEYSDENFNQVLDLITMKKAGL